MKRRFGQIIKLKPDCSKEYIRLHSQVWPSVLETIKLCHISNYTIFYKDNYLFAYFEYTGKDFDADMKKMSNDPNTQQWWDIVKPLMSPLETKAPDEFWVNMEEIFHID